MILLSKTQNNFGTFKKEKKNDFMESMENIAELFVEFFVEKLREKNIIITTRPLARIVLPLA